VCFLRNGFHATSMQDVIREAGLSVGAVYRYFPSKSDLIVAIAQQMADGIAAQLTVIAAEPDRSLTDVMDAAVGLVDANTGPDGILPLVVQVWAEAQRDPALRAMVAQIYGEIVTVYEKIAANAVGRGELPPDTDPAAVGSTLAALVLGYGILRLMTGKVDLTSYRAGLRAILDSPARGDRTLEA